MPKPYTWEEIRDFLEKEFKRTKHILTYATIGSNNIEHDIDTIITKKSKSKTSDFYREVHGLFDKLDSYLKKKYGANLISLQGGRSNELVHLSTYKLRDLIFDTMVYTSYSQIEKDWRWALPSDFKLGEVLNGDGYLLGKYSDLLSKEFKKEKYYDFMFIYLYHYDRINSHYPLRLILEIMNKNFEFLFRKRIQLKAPVAKNKKEIREIFYTLCDKLDELEARKYYSKTQKYF